MRATANGAISTTAAVREWWYCRSGTGQAMGVPRVGNRMCITAFVDLWLLSRNPMLQRTRDLPGPYPLEACAIILL